MKGYTEVLPPDDPRAARRVNVPPSQVAVPENVDVLRILMLSDLHIPTHPEATQRIVQNRSYLRQMDHVVLLGDMVSSYGTDREYEKVNGFIRQLERPYTAVNGNHEFYFRTPDNNPTRSSGLWEELDAEGKAAKLHRFLQFYGFDSLWRAQHTSMGSLLFLGLDDVHHHKVENLSDAQFEFLARQISVQPHLPAFIFCHAPLMLDNRLDMVYYEPERTACVEPPPDVRRALANREAPVFWMSGHIHLRPDHYLYSAYLAGPGVWQVHCPDSWGYSRWLREQTTPQRHRELYSRHLEIGRDSVTLITHDHHKREDIARQLIEYKSSF